MKKTKLMLFILSLVIGIFSIIPIKVLANTPDGTAADWFNHISQFDAGFAYCEPVGEAWGYEFGLLIVAEPSGEVEGYYFEYDVSYYSSSDLNYFEPSLRNSLRIWWQLMEDAEPHGDIDVYLADRFGEDFDGFLYWNFEENYWQIDYYNTSIDDNDNNNKEVGFMVTDLLDTLAEIGAGIGDLFGRIVESVGQFFYTPGTGDNPGSFTIIGILTIAAVVVSLSMWVLRLILRLFKLRG